MVTASRSSSATRPGETSATWRRIAPDAAAAQVAQLRAQHRASDPQDPGPGDGEEDRDRQPEADHQRKDFLVRLVATGAGMSASRRVIMCRSMVYSTADLGPQQRVEPEPQGVGREVARWRRAAWWRTG